MTIPKTKIVAIRFMRFGKFCLQNASLNPLTLSVLVAKRWNRAMTAPSNSVPGQRKVKLVISSGQKTAINLQNKVLPLPVLIVAGLKAFQTMVSQILVAINKEMLQRKRNYSELYLVQNHSFKNIPLPRAKSISFLKKFIQQQDNQTSAEKLKEVKDQSF